MPVDMGFIVYNEAAYPNLTALFEHFGVLTRETCMSLGISLDDGDLAFGRYVDQMIAAERRLT